MTHHHRRLSVQLVRSPSVGGGGRRGTEKQKPQGQRTRSLRQLQPRCGSPGSSMTTGGPRPHEASRAGLSPETDSVATCAPSPLPLPPLSLPPRCPGPALREHWQLELRTRWQRQEQSRPWQPGRCVVLSGPTAPRVAASPSSHSVVLTLLVPPLPGLELALFPWSPRLSRHTSPSAQGLSPVPPFWLSGPGSQLALRLAGNPFSSRAHPSCCKGRVIWGELEPGLTGFEKGWETGMEPSHREGGSDQTRMHPSTLCTSGILTRAQGGQDTPRLAQTFPTPFFSSAFPPLSKSCLLSCPYTEWQRPRVQLHLGFISS